MTAIRLKGRRTLDRVLAGLVRLRDRFMFSDGAWGSSKWPVRDTQENRPPFFVLGSPRSGTTLLRAILCAHPDVFIPPENGALGKMIRVFGSRRSAEWESVVDDVLGAFPHGYESSFWNIDLDSIKQTAKAFPQNERSLAALLRLLYTEYGRKSAPGKQIWGDKTTPGGFHYIYKVALTFPAARYVHIVRDGRDCVASSVRAGFFNKNYDEAAYAWRDNVRLCRQFERSVQGRFHELRYEDLVASPGDQIARLCTFLELEPSPKMLEHQGLVTDATPDVVALKHHSNVRRPISTASLGKWRTELPSTALDSVSRIVAPELLRYGYSAD